MSNKWTPQQLNAIETRNKNLLVSAAAGSGKTAVLVERIIRLVAEERVPIDQMLIVTFTNAAAGEMKERIQKNLQRIRKQYLQEQDQEKIDKTFIEFLGRQIQNVPRASISTVHSFCIQVLRDYFAEAGIDPAFKLLNESYGEILKNQAIEKALEERYNNKTPEFYALAESYGGRKNDKDLIELAMSIDNFVQAQPYPQKWLEDQLEFYKNLAEQMTNQEALEYFMKSQLGDKFKEIIDQLLERAKTALEEAVALAENVSKDISPLPQIENIVPELEVVKELLKITKNQGMAVFFEAVSDQDFGSHFQRLKFGRGEKYKAYKEVSEQIKNLRDLAKDIVKDKIPKLAQALNLQNLLEDSKYLYQTMKELISLVLGYRQIYQELKMENSLLDFSDLEHMVLKILENQKVRESIQNQYQYVFFDEYQDSNLVQETIVNNIKRDTNLFFVGDVKQSIYRFRLADPTIFNEKYKQYAKEAQSDKIDLSQNFRSRKEILNFCNLIFQNIMTEKYGEVDYTNEDHHLKGDNDLGNYEDHIQLVIIGKDKDDEAAESSETVSDMDLVQSKDAAANPDLQEDISLEDYKKIQIEALYVAAKIKELGDRGIDYKDMAILLRGITGKGDVFEEALSKLDIPSYVDYSSSNYDHLEIKCLLDYLRIVDNKNQDEALIGAMSWVFGGFTEEELIEIRKDSQEPNFYQAAQSYSQKMEGPLAEKLRDFYNKLQNDAQMEKMTNLADFVWWVAENNGLNTYISGMEDGANRLQNIKNMVAKAKEYDESEPLGLFGFLRHIDSILKGKGDSTFKSTILESENVVSIMSIHKSKGLEFKVVFVCDLGKSINEMDLQKEVILHNDLGIGIKYKNSELGVQTDTAIRMAISAQKQAETISEEIRLLYVAMTRAVDRLYLVGSVNKFDNFYKSLAEGKLGENVATQKNYLSWIAHVLVREKQGYVLRDQLEKEVEVKEHKGTAYSIHLLDQKQVPQMINITLQQEKRAKEELFQNYLQPENVNLFQQYAQFQYPYQDQINKRSKTSVTELVKEYKNKERNWSEIELPTEPLFEEIQTTFGYDELGTIVHFLMESLPIKSYDKDSLEEQIQVMIDKELLTEAEAAVIPRQRIIEFFQSDLGKRMIASPRVEREQSFLMRHEDSLVEGIVDCYFTEGEQIVILDYKTDRLMDPNRHKPQLAIYKEAVAAMEDAPVKEAYIYWINHDQFTKI